MSKSRAGVPFLPAPCRENNFSLNTIVGTLGLSQVERVGGPGSLEFGWALVVWEQDLCWCVNIKMGYECGMLEKGPYVLLHCKK